ncbi:MAG TPA: hypothetical protein VFZ32_15915 [Micromonosporaceae bacterium]
MTSILATWIPRVMLGAGIGLVIATAGPGSLQAQPLAVPSADGDLVIDSRDRTEVVGQYGIAGSLVSYDARRTGTDSATLRLVVNGVRLTATVDFASRSGSWSGDGQILGTEGKSALAGMERALARQIKPKVNPIGPHEALLYRAVSYWSEAPAGLALTGDSFSGVVESDKAKKIPAGEAGKLRRPGDKCLDPVTGEVSTAACQQSNEDGVLYTGCSGSAWACHDADSHCFTCASEQIGQAANCRGRCGGGCCVPDGLGIYTYDCLDHDTCCGYHGGCTNPWDSECGDEYWEADDDFLFGQQNCGWQC